MFIPKKIVDELRKKFKETSIKTIDSAIKRIYRDVFEVGKFDKQLLLIRSNEVIDFANMLTTGSKKTLLNSIRHVINKNDYKRLYNRAFYNVAMEYENEYLGKTPESFIRLEDLGNVNHDKFKGVKLLIYYLYTLLPPLRSQDWYNAKFYFKHGPGNHYSYQDKTLTIIDSKTSKKYGTKIIKLPKRITDYIEGYNQNDGENLIVNTRGNPYNAKSFTAMLYNIYKSVPIYGKDTKISIHLLRRTYISELLNHEQNTEKQMKIRKKLAKILGHSLSTQWSIYQNNDKIRGIKWSSKEYMDNIMKLFNEMSVKLTYD